MRIYQFQKLVIKEESQDFALRNCAVVIDGQNFLHNMYENSDIPFIFGCETDKYAYDLKNSLQMFQQANVRCYIVFKGGDTDISNKIKKFQRLYFDVNDNFEFIPPVLLKDATAQVIDEMGIDYAFCVTEAKDDCVALAQKLECSIISNDIEFCLRKAPYILSTTMKFDRKTRSIQCRQYKLQDFLQKYSLTEEKTAMFVTLTDSTVFPVDFFRPLFRIWRVSDNNQYIVLKRLIVWLSKHNEKEARDGITKNLSNDEDRNKFWLNYRNILLNMRKDEAGLATEYLLNLSIPIVKQDPEWFEKGVVCKNVPPAYINLYKSKVIEGTWLILDEHSPDSLFGSMEIIKYAYNLLTNYRGDTFKVYQGADNYIEINSADTFVERPSYDCKLSVFENGWDDVKRLKLFEHFLTENDIDTDILVELPEDSVVLFIALVYYSSHRDPFDDDKAREVYAVILCYVMLRSAPSTVQASVKSVMDKYFHYDKVEAIKIFDGTALRRLIELQYCILHMNYLNTLCGSPYKFAQYRTLYNGTFVFKILHDMRDKDPDNFVRELFQKTPSVLTSVEELIQVYKKLLSG